VSAKLGVLADVSVELHIPRGVFLPVPNVDSVMVRLVRREDAPDLVGFARVARVVDAAFAQRRKTLRNTLRSLGPADAVADAATRSGLDLAGRAEQVDPEGFVRLTAALGAVGMVLDP
jgi:16S rRNA (adenine1518-N6/adenine1519-N6)-dimethyltransferase